MKISQNSKVKAQRLFLVCILLSAFSSQLLAFLTGCTHLQEYSQTRKRLEVISAESLEGLSKVDIVKKFGEPLAISKSEVSECWYYARPCEIWIWFAEDKVERWESK